MKTIATILILSAAAASGHLTYTSRDFGTFSPGAETKDVTLAGTVSSTFGWAYATDDDFGDSHRLRAFRFTMLVPGEITLTIQRTGDGNVLLPAFSIYSGLGTISPEAPGHDGSSLTQAYLAGLGGAQPKQGAFHALGDWALGNEDTYNVPGDPGSGVLHAARLAHFTYQGHAADGTTAEFGSAAGILGDGLADGFVTSTFHLAAGDYTVMVGGAEYVTTPPAGPYTGYGVNVTLSVIPEPSAALLCSAAFVLQLLRRRR